VGIRSGADVWRRAGAELAGEGADAPGLGQRHAQPPVVREPHLARQLLQRQVLPVRQRALRRRSPADEAAWTGDRSSCCSHRHLCFGSSRSTGAGVPLGTGGVVGPASAGGVAPRLRRSLICRLVDSAGGGVRACEVRTREHWSRESRWGLGSWIGLVFFKLDWAEVLPEQYPAIPGPPPLTIK
jgi:hypothetical protein